VLLNGPSLEPGVLPQPVRNRPCLDAGGGPPRRLIAMPVKGTMMGATEGDCELIADPAAQGLGLHESEVMGVARLPPAHEARLRGHELQMGAVAIAARLAQRKGAFVDMPENGVIHRR
jgi:hypothetical protein